MIARETCEQAFREAVASCDPTFFVERALDGSAFELGIAVGKSALAMARGAWIREVNAVRTELSAIKGGKLARMCAGSLTTLVASDVIGDDPRVVGSGPTVTGEPDEHVEVVIHMIVFAEAVSAALRRH